MSVKSNSIDHADSIKFTYSFVQISAHKSSLQNITNTLILEKQSLSAYCILRTCSRIYAEAHSLHMKQTIFILKDFNARDYLDILVTSYADRRDETPSRTAQIRADHCLGKWVQQVQRLTLSDTAMLNLLKIDLPMLREVFIEPAEVMKMLTRLQSDAIDDRIAEARGINFEDFCRTCDGYPLFWSRTSNPPKHSGIRTLAYRHPDLQIKLKIKAAIATQGYTILKVREVHLKPSFC